MLDRHLAGLDLRVGDTVRLTASDLQRILGVSSTAWDPIMGKPGGLQRVVHDNALFPTASEWQGDTAQRPVLAAVTLVKWGGLARPDDEEDDAEHP
jgi:hypothetical protein